jgi:hypothetical protein
MEMESKYVDATIERFEQVTGEQAIHTESGLTFAQMKDWRVIEGEVDAANDNGTVGVEELENVG